MIDAAYITSAQLSCDPQETKHVIFRARLSRTPDVSNTQFVAILQEWVTSGSASVTLEHIRLDLDASCNVIINSLNDQICPVPANTPELFNTPTVFAEESGSDSTIIIAILAVVLVVLLVFACASMIYCWFWKNTSRFVVLVYTNKHAVIAVWRLFVLLVAIVFELVIFLYYILCRKYRTSRPTPHAEQLQERDVDHYEELPLKSTDYPTEALETDEKAENLHTATDQLNAYESIDIKSSLEESETTHL